MTVLQELTCELRKVTREIHHGERPEGYERESSARLDGYRRGLEFAIAAVRRARRTP